MKDFSKEEFPRRFKSTRNEIVVEFISENRGITLKTGGGLHCSLTVGKEENDFISCYDNRAWEPADDFLTDEELEALCDEDIMGMPFTGPIPCETCKQRCGEKDNWKKPVCEASNFYYKWEPKD